MARGCSGEKRRVICHFGKEQHAFIFSRKKRLSLCLLLLFTWGFSSEKYEFCWKIKRGKEKKNVETTRAPADWLWVSLEMVVPPPVISFFISYKKKVKMIRSSSNRREDHHLLMFVFLLLLICYHHHTSSRTHTSLRNIQMWIIWFAGEHHHITWTSFMLKLKEKWYCCWWWWEVLVSRTAAFEIDTNQLFFRVCRLFSFIYDQCLVLWIEDTFNAYMSCKNYLLF